MHTDGAAQTALTDNSVLPPYNYAYDYDPAFSPDGLQIAFTSTRDGQPEIYVMNANGTNQERRTTNPGRTTASPRSPPTACRSRSPPTATTATARSTR